MSFIKFSISLILIGLDWIYYRVWCFHVRLLVKNYNRTLRIKGQFFVILVQPYGVDDYSNLIFLWVRAGSNIKYEGDGQWYGHHVRL